MLQQIGALKWLVDYRLFTIRFAPDNYERGDYIIG